VVGPVKVRNPC